MRTTKRSRNLLYVACAVLALMLATGGCVSTSANDLSAQKYRQLTEPLLLGQLTKIYGAYKQGHGPYVWFELPDQKLYLWAFCGSKEDKLPDSSEVLDDTQLNKRLNAMHVMFLVEVEKNNEDNAKVVWPEQYVGQPVEQVYKALYKWAEKK
jgi:hypothetical protein